MTHRFIHTSDWHLGKKLFKENRIEEQEAYLSWLLVQIKKNKINSLCISGDIFDVPHPSTIAQSLYYQFLKEAVDNENLEIFIISGNHDSGRFLEAPLPFLKENKINILGSLEKEKQYSFHREGVSFHLFPYFRNHELFNFFKDSDLDSESEDTVSLIEKLMDSIFTYKKGNKNILLAHHLFGSGELSGSELGLSLSGIDSIPLSIIKERFDYTALGHLHNHQYLSKSPPIVYSGSPIPFRFSENKQKKINIIEIEKTDLKVTEELIPKFRALYQLKLESHNYKENLSELVKNIEEHELSPLLEVKIKSDKPLTGIADEIRNILSGTGVKLLSLQTSILGTEENQENSQNIDNLSPEQLFENFYLQKYSGEDTPPKKLIDLFNSLLDEARFEQGEAHEN